MRGCRYTPSVKKRTNTEGAGTNIFSGILRKKYVRRNGKHYSGFNLAVRQEIFLQNFHLSDTIKFTYGSKNCFFRTGNEAGGDKACAAYKRASQGRGAYCYFMRIPPARADARRGARGL